MSVCAWCEAPTGALRRDAVFCSKVCRQRAWRLKGRRIESSARVERAAAPLRMAYADPPYPGLSRRFYKGEASYAGEVNHVALLAELRGFDGWALSTAAYALRELLPLCPDGARVCPWVKPGRRTARTYGLHNGWEALIVVPGRRLRPGVVDWLLAAPARLGGSALKGRKPLGFVAWLFDCLGLLPGDELVDLYPGSGVVGRAWAQTSRAVDGRPVGPRGVATPAAATGGDGSRRGAAGGDASPRTSARPVAASSTATGLGAPARDASRVGRRRRVALGLPAERPETRP